MTAIVVIIPLIVHRGGTRFTTQQRAAKISHSLENTGAETFAEGPRRHN